MILFLVQKIEIFVTLSEMKAMCNNDMAQTDLDWFYGISTSVGYLMPSPVYTYILNIYDLVWWGFMAYQPL